MITVEFNSGHVIVQNMAYPIEITNLDTTLETAVTFMATSTTFTHDSIIVPPATTVTVYASTSSSSDTIFINTDSDSLSFEVSTQINTEIEYGTESYITIFELPPDQSPALPNKFATRDGKVIIRGNQILIQLTELEIEEG
jgi:arginine deiminase